MRDYNGDIYTVRYEAVNAMLLNEFLKEHRKVEQLEKQLGKITAGLQKVNAHLEANKPAPQLVADKSSALPALSSHFSIRFVKRDGAFEITGRIQNRDISRAKARAGFGICDGLTFLCEC